MKQIELGRTGIMVSGWCLGTLTFSTQTPQDDAHRQIDMALDAGLNFSTQRKCIRSIRCAKKPSAIHKMHCRLDQQSLDATRCGSATKAGGDSPLIRGGAGFTPENILDVLDGNLARHGYIDLSTALARGSYMFRQNWTLIQAGGNRARTIKTDHIGGVLEKS
jgi:hypothetical protein